MRILLTSTGLETTEIKDYFVNMVGKDMNLVKALFIPTAAINPDAIEVLPQCMHDLLKCGICKHNIAVYDLHYGMEINELSQYDLLYICGGNTKYLLQRVNETGFNMTLLKYIQEGGSGGRSKCRKYYFCRKSKREFRFAEGKNGSSLCRRE